MTNSPDNADDWAGKAKAWVAILTLCGAVMASAIAGTLWIASELSSVRQEIISLRLEVAERTASVSDLRGIAVEVRDLDMRLRALEMQRR